MNHRSMFRTAAIAAVVCLSWTGLTAQERGTILPAYEPGDLNQNGMFDFDDVALLRAVFQGARHDFVKEMLDVDRNGRIEKYDLEVLTRWARRGASSAETLEEEGLETAQAPEREEADEWIRGDVDGDGDVDVSDAILMQEIVMGVNRPRGPKETADYNRDGRIDIADLVALVADLYPAERTAEPELSDESGRR